MSCVDPRRHSTTHILERSQSERRHIAVAANKKKTAHWAAGGNAVQSGRIARGSSAAGGGVPALRMSGHQRLLLQQQLQQQHLASSPDFQQLFSQQQQYQQQQYLFHQAVSSSTTYDDPTAVDSVLDYSTAAIAAPTTTAASPQHQLPFFHHQSNTTSVSTDPIPFPVASFCNTDNTHSDSVYYPQVQQQQLQQLQVQTQQHRGYDLFALQPQQSQFIMSSPQQQTKTEEDSQSSQQPQHDASASSGAAGLTDEQLAEYQKLSSEYEPEVTGPLVGQRQPSTAITSEYASADPAYQRKTAALPQKYSHYRTVRGDGRCGWRAIAFGYFETLIALADNNRFVSEEARLRALSDVLNSAGFDPMLYEDFADETFELLQRLPTATAAGTAEQSLLETFNDEGLQNYIITHLKTLTSAWMKTHQDDYLPWLLGQSVDSYTDNSVMPILSEIDHVSLNALKDVFLSPASISLEVLYLDRSEGAEVNMHQFSPMNSSEGPIGTIRLLYRPGHYDILYKQEDLPVQPSTVTTYLQYGSTTDSDPVMPVGVSDYLTMIPGISFAGPSQPLDWYAGAGATSSPADFQVPSTVQHTQHTQSTPSISVETTPSLGSSVNPHQPGFMPVSSMMPHSLPHRHSSQSVQLVRDLPIRRKQSLDSALQHLLPSTAMQPHSTPGPFRSSAWELEPDFLQLTSQGPPRTRAFHNSHYNTAHFMNPSFHPEEWRPEEDETPSARYRNSH